MAQIKRQSARYALKDINKLAAIIHDKETFVNSVAFSPQSALYFFIKHHEGGCCKVKLFDSICEQVLRQNVTDLEALLKFILIDNKKQKSCSQ